MSKFDENDESVSDHHDDLVMPGQSILVRVYLDPELDDSESVAPEILFDDLLTMVRNRLYIELVS